ncbi:MAG: hypothetical protein K6U14_07080 [Firmicutes bacterium]|nr:hypothetical protein [Alicyclobacillaceae bacterium]MCL6497381.1 hypothetical protein [Bacillota bacterium]
MGKYFEVQHMMRETERLLATEQSPRRRAILKNFRRHGMLEVAGRWEEILTPEMIVEHPVYRITEKGKTTVLDGMEAVRQFYRQLTESRLNVFGALEERIAVADWGLAIQSLFGHFLPGRVLLEQGETVDDPDGWYFLTHWLASIWPYDEQGRLMGEYVYEDTGSRHIEKMDPKDVVTPEQARAILDPLIDQQWD